MYTATFTFAAGALDEAFQQLDQRIAEAARAITGYRGEESWENSATGLVSNVYYWDSLEALRQLMDHPAHGLAKQGQAQWLKGYQVVIAQVVRSYGDGGIPHPLAALPPASSPGPGPKADSGRGG
ncbi:MAG: antibiotic biosynthesis monooxygenase [Rhodoferax sp.]|nr:antibiotic biosynthesis monooxygenase [Rhodoferax sp.]